MSKVVAPPVRDEVATMMLPSLASLMWIVSPSGTVGATVTVTLNAWPGTEGFGPLSTSVVVVGVRLTV